MGRTTNAHYIQDRVSTIRVHEILYNFGHIAQRDEDDLENLAIVSPTAGSNNFISEASILLIS